MARYSTPTSISGLTHLAFGFFTGFVNGDLLAAIRSSRSRNIRADSAVKPVPALPAYIGIRIGKVRQCVRGLGKLAHRRVDVRKTGRSLARAQGLCLKDCFIIVSGQPQSTDGKITSGRIERFESM